MSLVIPVQHNYLPRGSDRLELVSISKVESSCNGSFIAGPAGKIGSDKFSILFIGVEVVIPKQIYLYFHYNSSYLLKMSYSILYEPVYQS